MSKVLIEFDASGQESRFMAALSGDANMCRVFNSQAPYDDLHSFTGSRLQHIEFEDFIRRYLAKEDAIAGPKGGRYLGKFTNLSCQYRIGAPSLRIKARIDYGLVISLQESERILSTFVRTYPGIPSYWDNAIVLAKSRGYAETLGGHRYYITRWDKRSRWQSESSAINTPIQGSGADQKYLAIHVLDKYFPKFNFRKDLHDGLFYWVEYYTGLERDIEQAKEILDHLPYKKFWGWEPPIPFPWDAKMGENWGNLKELK